MWGRMRRWWNRQDPRTRRHAAIVTVLYGGAGTLFFSLPEGLSAASIGLGLLVGLSYGTGTLFWGWWGQRRRRRRDAERPPRQP